ncbi:MULTISPECIES: thioredoxin family protein [unclassified Kaistella]|uniref:thioredoxin family protein n=1 Tax=unclassified Kaistella TaxID=2762626 RepID=UPI0027370C1F|nr:MULTISPECIES: thioredoxin family protein [unclassified Kaistella]MCZ2084959.1 thioredoxin family protein [Flavobacteriales bacterium]MDP2453758.1 thioredoxin family protein [Kaistella sp. SH11-4b]MDP2456815.1 thioredoxin family protein [Kaistella sp. SH40-3]MDP2459571.1 thioredoxin family protein [Kaistella sp. SH19-2b]
MKKTLTAFLLLTYLISFSQETINFENTSFKEVLAKAKKEKKLVFMDAFASWCGPCKMMEKNIFPLPAVKAYYNSNFINARFDMEKGEGRDIALKYGVRSYPSYLFLNGDGEIIMKSYGYMGEEDFIAIAKEANNPLLLSTSPKELFDKGESDPTFLLNMMRQNAQTDYELAKKVSERYFKVIKNQEFTRDDIGMLLYFVKSPTDVNYQIFKDKKADIVKEMSEDIYNQFDVNIKISHVMEDSLDKETKLINDDYFYKNAIPLVGKTEAEVALNRMKVIYYPNVGNFKEYEKAALVYYKHAENFDPEELLKAAWIFSEHVDNKVSLQKAEEWAEKSVMSSETAENTYILAKIYQKTGKKENAKIYADMSKNLAEQQGKDSSAAKQLLETLK